MKRVLAPRVLNRQEGSVLKLETTRMQGWPLARGYMPCNPCPNPQLFERVAGMRKGSISGSSWRCIEKKNPWGVPSSPLAMQELGPERTTCGRRILSSSGRKYLSQLFHICLRLHRTPRHYLRDNMPPFPELVKSLSDTSVLHPSLIMNTRLEFMNCMAARRLGD
ncbi:unnamed protein product [Trypanosoma congolense IL3000]|uniref:WGS project CAEQ00000000 data, annotated contig 1221 n=1 Tax=Trypanosoma congolense (strain IL3000) TaxID=1068625 RepID=F9W4S5_TRYCI|nr:unnamed protein product [Trypanosoma congolense IL3000]